MNGDSTKPTRPHRGWLYGLSAAAALAALVLWFAPDAPSLTPLGPQRAISGRGQASPSFERHTPAEPATVTAGPSAPVGAPPPVIDEVIIEKPDLCEGEETLVTVRAHTVDATDSELHYLIGARTGQSVPLRAWLDEQGNPPALQLTVFGKDNVATTLPLPPLRLRPCAADTHAVLSHRSLPNRWGTFEFLAQVRQSANGKTARSSVALRPRSYTWTFGDGTRSETSAGEVSHSYEDRPQQTSYSQFLVQVEVDVGRARPLIARDALQLPNPAYESWSRKGIVSLMISLDPIFPTLSAAGRVEQGVRLRHHRPEPVRIESVQAVRHSQRDVGQSPPEPVDVIALLGTDTIPPGPGLELHVTLDVQARPDVSSVTYYLKGKSAAGSPVIGSFSVMRPPPKPSAENSTPVTDPELLDKIRSARARLGKDVVSADDLARLERLAHPGEVPPPNL